MVGLLVLMGWVGLAFAATKIYERLDERLPAEMPLAPLWARLIFVVCFAMGAMGATLLMVWAMVEYPNVPMDSTREAATRQDLPKWIPLLGAGMGGMGFAGFLLFLWVAGRRNKGSALS